MKMRDLWRGYTLMKISAAPSLTFCAHWVTTYSAFEAEQANQKIPDEEVLQFAISKQRILFTYNRKHFIRLHRISPVHFGIVVCTEDDNVAH